MAILNGFGGDAGFGENTLSRNDDGSSPFIDLSSIFEDGLNFFGTSYSGLYINTNGGVTFDTPLRDYTPQVISGNEIPGIFPFWADIDTRGGAVTPSPGGVSQGTNLVHYDLDEGADTFTVTWDDVGYFNNRTNLTNTFQLALTDLSDTPGADRGDFSITFRYEDIQWTTGDASGGAGGLGGAPARVGYSAGNGTGNFFELPSSGVQDALLALEDGPDLTFESGGDASASGAQLFRLYQTGLDRLPDTAGYSQWLEKIATDGIVLTQVAQRFLDSAEYIDRYGALDNAAFVTQLYDNTFGRLPDDAGLAGWVSRLDAGAGRADIMVAIAESPESKARTREDSAKYVEASSASGWVDDVYGLYGTVLDRQPEPAGLDGWVMRLTDGVDARLVAESFVGSREFETSFGELDDAALVELFYDNALDRMPDAAELAGWVDRLEAGASRAEVGLGFVGSREYMVRSEGDVLTFMRDQTGETLVNGPGADVLIGSYLSDTFVLNAADADGDTVLYIDPWDTLSFQGFGFVDRADALSAMTSRFSDLVLSRDDVTVTLADQSLDTIEDVFIIV